MYVWKYPITITDEFDIELPKDAKILCVQMQGGVLPCIWVQTSGVEIYETRHFSIIGTGNPFLAEGLIYIGTFQQYDGQLVWHLFERVE